MSTVVKDPTLRSLEDRLAFEAPVFSTFNSNTVVGGLRWDTPVDVLSEGVTRTRVRSETGVEGWIANDHWVRVAFVDRDRVRGQWRYSTPLYRGPTGSSKHFHLLWGDRVQVIESDDNRSRVHGRGRIGWVKNSVLDGTALLETYFIDVGQGDGVLIRTPDGRHLLIDGGYPRTRQPTGKNAADFVDWKFFKDYGALDIDLDAMIASHSDLDHYGGLWDLISIDEDATRELDARSVDVDEFYHAGVSWWRPGDRWLGRTQAGHLVDLLGDMASIRAGLEADADPKLQGNWADFMERIEDTASSATRLGVSGQAEERHLPGFAPADAGDLAIRVLGPLVSTVGGAPAVRDLGADAQNTNGHSIVLMLTYRGARILMTGDLNKASQHRLLEAYRDDTSIFACDVAKGCHHGSDDVSFSFLQAMNAAATVISSGDNEGHGHPRPSIVAASAVTGHAHIDTSEDELRTPLVFMTEVERSIDIGAIQRLEAREYPHDGDTIDVTVYAVEADRVDDAFEDDAEAKEGVESRLHLKVRKPSAFRAEKKDREFKGAQVVSGVVYGLVNVRTDGDLIMCATMNEAEDSWNIHTFPSRF